MCQVAPCWWKSRLLETVPITCVVIKDHMAFFMRQDVNGTLAGQVPGYAEIPMSQLNVDKDVAGIRLAHLHVTIIQIGISLLRMCLDFTECT